MESSLGSLFPQIIRSFATGSTDESGEKKYITTGQETLENPAVVSPFQDGYIQNWEAAESLWSYTLHNKLRYNKDSFTPILITEPLMCSKDDRTTIVQTFFETFEVLAVNRFTRVENEGSHPSSFFPPSFFFSCLRPRHCMSESRLLWVFMVLDLRQDW